MKNEYILKLQYTMKYSNYNNPNEYIYNGGLGIVEQVCFLLGLHFHNAYIRIHTSDNNCYI